MKVYLGGEAKVKILEDIVIKTRIPKRYRIKELDRELRLRRTKMEAKIMSTARRIGVPTPIVLDIEEDTIVMERIRGKAVKDVMSEEVSKEVGRMTAKLHRAGIIHGDITPMNLILSNSRIYFVDFGLAFFDNKVEPMGVDVHVYFESLKASFENWEELRDAFIEGYLAEGGSNEIIERAKEIEERGRYVERVSLS